MSDDIQNFFYLFFQRKQVNISCESSAKQTIHLKCQDLFCLKKKKKMSSAAVVIGTLRVSLDFCCTCISMISDLGLQVSVCSFVCVLMSAAAFTLNEIYKL